VLQVPDIFLLQLAAAAALTAQARGKLTTRSLHAELLYNLSGSRQVS
jgi:tRNA threonylcarbamoyladenosine modification (KEOPS) complex Cgi121 subunit